MRRYLPPVVAAVVMTATLQAAAPAAANSDGGAEAVRVWNRITVETLSSFVPPNAIPAPVHPLYLSYVHRAVYDAVDDLPREASFSAAVTGAAHRILSHYFPDHRLTTFEPAYDQALRASDGRPEALGLAAGEEAAERLLEERESDGLNGPALPLPRPGELRAGVWVPIPAGPPAAAASWLGGVDPFVLRSPSEFRPGRPPALTSDRWAEDYEEVRTLGSQDSTARTQDQTDTALLWGEPPAVQSQRALRDHSRGSGALATARLFALANTASADSLIACADAKFRYDFWRPVGAINGIPADDGNPATTPQPGWASLVPTPNFPEYPSNHSCTTTAVARVVDALDGDRPFRLTVTRGPDEQHPVDSVTFRSADKMIANVADGRVWSGLHYRFSTDAGTEIGDAVAAKVLRAEG